MARLRTRRAALAMATLGAVIGATAAPGAAQGGPGGAGASAGAAAERPNVIMIAADDLGYDQLSLNGGDIPTPNIDRIADEGVRFTDGYVTSPVCTPSRQALMTGRHPAGHGGDSNQLARTTPERLPTPTVANLLDDSGYTTGAIGKWDLAGFSERWQDPDVTLPHQAGFDSFYGSLRGMENYCSGEGKVWEDTGDGSYDSFPNSSYMTDEYTDKAEQFVQEQRGAEDPYYLYLSYTAPHAPIESPSTCPERDVSAPTYRDMVQNLDKGIGRVLDSLGDEADNTMVMFVSDHGSQYPEFVPSELRGKKYTLFEGGVRTPMAMRWPAGLRDAPATYEPMVSTLDFLPTVAAAAGREVSGYPGADLVPYLNGKASGVPYERLHWKYVDDEPTAETQGRVSLAVRSGDYKYLRQTGLDGGTSEYLFDVAKDIGERHNLAGDPDFAGVRDRLVGELNAWNEQHPLQEDFAHIRPDDQPRGGKPDGFVEPGGEWQVTEVDGDNKYGGEGRSTRPGSYYSDVRFDGDVRVGSGDEAGLTVRGGGTPEAPSGYEVRLAGGTEEQPGRGRIVVDRVVDGEATTVRSAPADVRPGTDHRLRVRMVGGTLHVSLAGQPVLTWTDDDPLRGGQIGLTARGATAYFDNLDAKSTG